MAKITQKLLEAIRSNQAGETIREEGNLFGRIRAKMDNNVTVSFYYRYRFDEKLKDFSCGTWPGESLSKVRANRDAARTRVAQGIDPGAQKKIHKQEVQDTVTTKLAEIERKNIKSLTVQDLFDVWLLDGVRRKDGNAQLKRSFKADTLPKIGSISISNLTEHDLRDVLRTIVKRGVNRTAVIMRNNLTQMFAWAEKRQPWRKLLINGDPMDLIEIEKIVSPDYDMNNERDRILSNHEIRELQDIFNSMHTAYDDAPDKRSTTRPVAQPTQRAIWIMLSTMCRVGEMSMARWDQVDLDTGVWFIPKANVKDNVSDLTIFLSTFALDQFSQLRKITGHSEWCFPARNNEGHVCIKSASKQIGDRQSMFKKGKDGNPRKAMKNRRHDNTLVLGGGQCGAWTPHDLRRTSATLMQRLGIAKDVIDCCQNHVMSGSKVRRHYLHHDYALEKREAWKILGDQLSLILAGCEQAMTPVCENTGRNVGDN